MPGGYKTSPGADKANVMNAAISVLVLHPAGRPAYVGVSIVEKGKTEEIANVISSVVGVRNPQLRDPS